MSYIILIVTGLITGAVLGEAVSVLHHAIKIKREEEKNHDRNYKNAQSNKEGDSGFYPVSSERGTDSSIPGSSDNGKSLGKMEEEAIHSRDYISRYCGSQSCCSECCFGYNSSCSLRQGPPCMWVIEDKRIHKNEDLENN